MRPLLFDPRYRANSFSFQIDSVARVKWRNRALFKQLALTGELFGPTFRVGGARKLGELLPMACPGLALPGSSAVRV